MTWDDQRPWLSFHDLDRTIETLEARGCHGEHFGIPHVPGWAYRTPGGHHVAAYQLTRPEAAERLRGRRDF